MSLKYLLRDNPFTGKDEPSFRQDINEVLSKIPLDIKKKLVRILKANLYWEEFGKSDHYGPREDPTGEAKFIELDQFPEYFCLAEALDDLEYELFPDEYTKFHKNPFRGVRYPGWYFMFRDHIVGIISSIINMNEGDYNLLVDGGEMEKLEEWNESEEERIAGEAEDEIADEWKKLYPKACLSTEPHTLIKGGE